MLEIWPNAGAGSILFYPGSMLAPGHYPALLTALRAAGFAVAALHLSGHGKNIGDNGFNFADLLEQGLMAEKWLHANGYGPVAVCGHSQGGILTLAHAAESRTITAAFSICAVFPQMPEAIHLTRFAPLAKKRNAVMDIINRLARLAPGLPVPLPVYLSPKRIIAGKKTPVIMGKDKGRLSYPLKFLASLFDAKIPSALHCPFWLISAENDALFNKSIISQTFKLVNAPRKRLLWLHAGGHMAALNPMLCDFIARNAACACAGLDFPLNIEQPE